MKTILLAATAVLMPVAAMANEGMAASDAYALSSNAQAGAAFMRLENHGKSDCTLTGTASPAAAMVELHTSKEEGGVMKMVKLEGGVTVPAGDVRDLARGGDHVMFMGLTEPWKDGMKIPVTLDFGDCGKLDLEVPVDNNHKPDDAAMDGAKMDHSSN